MPSTITQLPPLRCFKFRAQAELDMADCDRERAVQPVAWHIEILLEPDDEAAENPDPATQTKVGWMHFVAVDDELVGDPYAALDAVSQEYADYGAVIRTLEHDPETFELGLGPYLIMDRVQLDEPFRGYGLGTYLAGMAMKVLGGTMAFPAVIVNPFPLDIPRDAAGRSIMPKADLDAAIAAVARSWERLGFHHYRDGYYVLDRTRAGFDERLAALREALPDP
jgi:GNAT superfamily N-acetyltransferase